MARQGRAFPIKPHLPALLASNNVAGSGSLAFSFSESASGKETFSGSGDLAFSFSIDGSGTIRNPITGTGDLAFSFSIAATGKESIIGSGDLAFGFTLTGSAKESFIGSGDLSFGFSFSGAGKESFLASGNLGYGFAFAGQGSESFIGSGALSFGFTSSGSGSEEMSGSGALPYAFSIAGSGTVTSTGVAGSGDLTFSFSESGAGSITTTGVPDDGGGMVPAFPRGAFTKKPKPRKKPRLVYARASLGFSFYAGGTATSSVLGQCRMSFSFSLAGNGEERITANSARMAFSFATDGKLLERFTGSGHLGTYQVEIIPLPDPATERLSEAGRILSLATALMRVLELEERAKQRPYYYDTVGVKRWHLGSGGKSGNCENCIENEEAGWIDQDDVFPASSQYGVVDEAPLHDHCDCEVEYGEKRKRVYA